MRPAENLIRVARALDKIREYQFVFAGASILPLLLNDPAAPAPRFSVDVDAVIDIATYARWEQLQARLDACGLTVRADVGKGRICLFHFGNIEVDIMPVRLPEVLPPSPVLEMGLRFPEYHQLESDLAILSLSPAGFLAAKLEAFRDRGIQDVYMSKDLQDIVTLLDGRTTLGDDIENGPIQLRDFIVQEIPRLISDRQIRDVISDLIRDPVRESTAIDLLRRIGCVKGREGSGNIF